MAATELPRPGVEVIQQFTSAAPTIVRPTLRPFVTGAAKEIIEVTDADGLINSDAKQGTYVQLPKTIPQLSFPSPRGNIAEVNVEEATIKTFLLNGGVLDELARDPGEAFLVGWNKASRAALRTTGLDPDVVDVKDKTLVLAIDVPARLNTTEDAVVTFASVGTDLTAQQVADQINNAVGEEVASVVAVGGGDVKVLIASNTYGALSSVTVRQGGSANDELGFASDAETRIEGSGFRGQDQNNNTTVTPWVEWFRGEYFVTGVETAFPVETDGTFGVGLINMDDEYSTSKATELKFTGPSSISLEIGDELYADGVLPNSAQVMKVETARFKLGTINSHLSTYDEDGKVVVAVYDPATVNTLYASAPWSPRYAWFKARNLVYGLLPQAAYLEGTTEGTAAELAAISSTTAILGDDGINVISGGNTLSLAGLTLKFVMTVNGVEGEEQTFTFSGGPFASVDAIRSAIGDSIEGMVPTDSGSNILTFSTEVTGATQAITLKATSTANSRLKFSTSDDTSDVGTDVEFRDVPPCLKTSVIAPASLTVGLTLVVKMSTDYDALSPTWTAGTCTHVFAGGKTTIAQIVTELNNDHTSTDYIGPLWGDWHGNMRLEAVAYPTVTPTAILIRAVFRNSPDASKMGLQFDDATSTCDPTGMDFDLPGGIPEDGGEANLAGLILKLRLNNRPTTYQALLPTNSLVDAVEAINAAVGWPVASISGDNDAKLTITSDLKGSASVVRIMVDTWTTGTKPLSIKAAAALGFNVAGQTSDGTLTAGSGRPNPDFYLDVNGSVVLGAEILRNLLTGIPYAPGSADTYIQYTGLRKDVSPMAEEPAMLTISDTTTLDSVLNPINSKNPLALGMYFAIINAPGLECCGMGVDEISAAEPYGTPLAYSRVATFIQSEEVYGIAPMTHSETVAQIFKSHIEFMSEPENKGERILFFNPPVPTRAVDDLMATGTDGNTTATANEFVGDSNPTAALVNAGIDVGSEIPVSDDLFVKLTIATSTTQEIRNYSVKSVNGVVWEFRTTFSGHENEDAFYSETPLTESLINTDWQMAIRGAPLLISGSTLPDKDKIAETVAAKCAVYKQRRLYYVFPEKVKATLGGTEELIEAFYACACYVGLVASQPPQQGFTNLPVTGLTGVVGSNDYFSNRQLNIMAAGGCFILVQDAPGGPITCRHQLSTNTTSIETRELSITKDVDFVAKFLRAGLRNFIGVNNITQPFLDQLSTVIHGMNQFLEENGIVISADINNIIQSKEQPDTVLVDETLNVPYPCNYIRLTLAI